MSSELSKWVEHRIEGDDSLSDDIRLLILAALEGPSALDEHLGGRVIPTTLPSTHAAGSDQEGDVPGAFLTGLSVSGFRGIGPEVDVAFQPQPGLTIIAGRNGSGKSSLSESLEVALTGTTYRWKRRTAQWREHWRNLHSPTPASIEVRVAEEGLGVTRIGVDWDERAESVDEATTWVQRPGAKRTPGSDELGWQRALETYRPMMSYDELGGLLEGGPSGLYDALSAALGVEELAAAIKLLDARYKAMREPEGTAARIGDSG